MSDIANEVIECLRCNEFLIESLSSVTFLIGARIAAQRTGLSANDAIAHFLIGYHIAGHPTGKDFRTYVHEGTDYQRRKAAACN